MLKKLIFATFFAMIAAVAVGQHREEAFFQPQSPDSKAVQIYPNPAVDVVSIKFDAPQAKKVKYTVHNLLGNTLDLESEIVDDFEIRIRVKDLSAGYYFISLRDERINQRGTYKFLKR